MTNLIGQSLGRYHILEQLGEGGMAIVYKARDTRLNREVAVKVIRLDAFPSEHQKRLLERFKREAKVLANLSHPNIVKVLDYSEKRGSPYLVMELVPGSTLKKRLGKPMPWREAAHLLAPIAHALERAHGQTGVIIHRDVKPSNILLTAGGIPMLSDFGIAKVLEAEETFELTATGAGIGTPEYMAPEQAGKGFDHRVDIYALGTVFYEMITGRKPFEADTPMAVVIKKNTDPPPLPTKFVPNLPIPVEQILLKALARNPNDRYQDMNSFALALENLAQGILPKLSAPPFKTQKISIRMADPKLWLGLGGVIAFCVIGAIGIRSFIPPHSTPEPTEQAIEEEQIPTGEPILDGLPLLDIPTSIETKTSVKDNSVFVLVPEGEFIMGSDPGEPYFWGAEAPKHNIYLDAFWIHQTEITNSMYRACVDNGTCSPPLETSSRTHKDYYDNEIYQDYPVINITYNAASAYCAWIDGRLPTEAEWEKAARGTDGRLFPWGNDEIQDNLANLCDANCTNLDIPEFGLNDGYMDVAPVGSFPAGMSPYGAMDMAGNVLEWTSDWYAVDYYENSPYENPTGPASGNKHPIRGGSWSSLRDGMRPSARTSKAPNDASDLIGFRCAQDRP
jgi:eukaryotic-like serine/threonine-protein kinase